MHRSRTTGTQVYSNRGTWHTGLAPARSSFGSKLQLQSRVDALGPYCTQNSHRQEHMKRLDTTKCHFRPYVSTGFVAVVLVGSARRARCTHASMPGIQVGLDMTAILMELIKANATIARTQQCTTCPSGEYEALKPERIGNILALHCHHTRCERSPGSKGVPNGGHAPARTIVRLPPQSKSSSPLRVSTRRDPCRSRSS